MTITLEQIEADHARIGALIDEFKKQPRATEYHVDAVTVPLAAGERIAGQILLEDGSLSHYLILLPGEAEDLDWEAAKAWAAERGGELPTRREQSLLFANLKGEFEERAYWSAERHAENSGWAWFQDFTSGTQSTHHQGNELRARAVRRFIPSVI
ncbi:DUF1566 domain-containing protein [Burkholderia humptydooensis]|uniref:DUF1566 domain-containing protein n=2 Tax=Burkholderia humptydooensis TaxID=430531 RepID=A0A7U4PBE8_9BURK|nr:MULTISPECIES: DUF1566 domain-containing protein [Burkholderia]AJY40018.1 hypothetical protein BW21_4763 [Burkholderia sp. 2002721687]ALX46445.1 hypothetical protein AQ610_29290 [Burkholderia humptydooensis]EIP85878.1 hypothetical protein A33K_16968 [Burkholderia humptydooensis MSMB43]QPS45755.1 DUF1566 domain-containing protein [Burkholderia humptydooensis]